MTTQRSVKVKVTTKAYADFQKQHREGGCAYLITSAVGDIERAAQDFRKYFEAFVESEGIDRQRLLGKMRDIESLRDTIFAKTAEMIGVLENMRRLLEQHKWRVPEELLEDKSNSWQYEYVTFDADKDEEIAALPQEAIVKFAKMLPLMDDGRRENSKELARGSVSSGHHYWIYRYWDGTLWRMEFHGVAG